MQSLVGRSLIFFLFFFCLSTSRAATTSFSQHGFNITIEPVVGFESTQRGLPSPHVKTMFIYGARFTAGNRMIAAEGEYMRGEDNEAFVNPVQTIKTKKENVRLGARTIQGITSWLDGVIRFGGQASRLQSEVTASGTTTKYVGAWEIRPYLGAGLELHLLSHLSLSAQAAYLFRNLKDWKQNEIQATASVKVSLPSFKK